MTCVIINEGETILRYKRITDLLRLKYKVIRTLHSVSRIMLSAQRTAVEEERESSLAASRDTYSLTHTVGRGNLNVCVRTHACALSVQSRALTYYIFPCVQYRCVLFSTYSVTVHSTWSLLIQDWREEYFLC